MKQYLEFIGAVIAVSYIGAAYINNSFIPDLWMFLICCACSGAILFLAIYFTPPEKNETHHISEGMRKPIISDKWDKFIAWSLLWSVAVPFIILMFLLTAKELEILP